MPLHLAQRLHAFVNGLFRPSDKAETQELYHRLRNLFHKAGLNPNTAQLDVAKLAASQAADALGISSDHPQHRAIEELSRALLSREGHFTLPDIDWNEPRSITVWWELRDSLNAQRPMLERYDEAFHLITGTLVQLFHPLFEGCPALLDTKPARGCG